MEVGDGEELGDGLLLGLGLVLGDGLLLGLGLLPGLLLGLGLVLGDGLLLGLGLLLGDGLELLLPGLGDRPLGLGFGLVLIVGVGVGLPLGDGELLLWCGFLWCGLLPLWFAFPVLSWDFFAGLPWLALFAEGLAVSDTDAASATPLPCPVLCSEATLTVSAGRVAHDRSAASAEVRCVPPRKTLARPHETTAVPAHAPKVTDPARRVLTISASPRSMSHQGLRPHHLSSHYARHPNGHSPLSRFDTSAALRASAVKVKGR